METETLEKKSKRRYWYFLIALTVAGFLMRLLGCFWGMPLLLHPDEPATVDYAMEMLSRHSWMAQSFDRPDHFEIKCDAILFAVFSRLYYHQPAYVAFETHAHSFYLVARFFSALFGTALIPLTMLFAQELLEKQPKCVGRMAGLCVGCGVGFLPIFIRYSTLANPDVVLCFFVVLFTWMLRRYLVYGKDKYIYFGALIIGICVTIKYNGAILCLPLALAVVYRSLRNKKPVDILRLGAFSVLLVVCAVFLIAPNLFLDYQAVISNVLREARPEHLGADGLSFTGNLRFYLTDFLHAFGMETWVLLLWGLVCVLRMKDKGLLCLLTGAIYWGCMSVLKLHWSRWGIPVYPFFMLLIGIGLGDLYSRARAMPKGGKAVSAVVLVFTAGVLVNSFVFGLSDTKHLTVPDSRQLALRDFEALGITAENSIYEGYTPFDPAGYTDKTDAFCLTDGEITVAPEYADKTYFVMSDSFSGRYAAEPERYAQKNAIYASIAEHYPVVYTRGPDGNRSSSKWILPNILDCLDYLTARVTCSGSPITVYKLQ